MPPRMRPASHLQHAPSGLDEKVVVIGSWLNIVETLFGKMARTFLRHIRVQSWEELQNRILRGIAEINAAPVVHRWKKFEALTTS
jgi:hypothetical protein